jgi:hypothetical protein
MQYNYETLLNHNGETAPLGSSLLGMRHEASFVSQNFRKEKKP